MFNCKPAWQISSLLSPVCGVMTVLLLTVSFAGGSLLIIWEKKFGVFPHPPFYSSRILKYMYKGCVFQA